MRALWGRVMRGRQIGDTGPSAGSRGGDTTPGGIASAFLQEDGVFGFLLEDGISYLLME